MALRFLRSLTGSRAAAEPRPGRADLRFVRHPGQLLEGNRVELLRRGERSFPAMLEAIASARSHVHLETYILRSDKTGERFKAALLERARAGVRVRLMFDSVGSFNAVSDEFLGELAAAGVAIVEFDPITPWRGKLLLKLHELRAASDRRRGRPVRTVTPREPGHWSFNRRDHQKILVVDDRVAFTGGLNIGDEYAPGPEGGDWHDLHVRIEGPAAVGLARMFHRAWLLGGGESFSVPAMPPSASAKLRPMLAHTCDNFGMRNRSRMHSAYRHAIRAAERSVRVMNAYFIPDPLLIWALTGAVKRGVDVRVMVPARSDVELVRYASQYLFGRLLRGGVRIFEYPDRMMHAKAAAVDGAWATIGSFNLDRRSMLHNLESGVVVLDAALAHGLEVEFESSLATCREISLAEWKQRRVSQRVAEWFAHLFAYWL